MLEKIPLSSRRRPAEAASDGCSASRPTEQSVSNSAIDEWRTRFTACVHMPNGETLHQTVTLLTVCSSCASNVST